MANILIVDDSRFSLHLLSQSLVSLDADHVLLAFEEGEKALQVVAEMTPDLAIVDYNMPEMNGIDLTLELLKTMPASHVAVVTGDSGFESGALQAPDGVRVFKKPITKAKLAEIVRVLDED